MLESETDNAVKPATLSWEDFSTLMMTHDRRVPDVRAHEVTGVTEDQAKRGVAWVPATYRGHVRNNVNVKTITLATFDLDVMPDPQPDRPRAQRPITPAEWLQILERVEASGYAAIVHSSYRYDPAKPKGRIIFRPSRPMLPGEWPHVRTHLIEKLQLPADPATKDLTRLYFLPAAPVGAPVFAATTDGTARVDVDEIVKGQRVDALSDAVKAIATDKARAALEAARAASSEPVDLALLRKLLKTCQGKNRELVLVALSGKPFADEGGRDNAINRLMSAARFCVPPNTPSEALVEIFRESLQNLPGGTSEDWLAIAKEKADRHLERRVMVDAAREAQQKERVARMMHESSRSAMGVKPTEIAIPEVDPTADDVGGSSDASWEKAFQDSLAAVAAVGPYSEAQLATWAAEQGCETVSAFEQRWIITHGAAHYVFAEGRYLPPILRENLAVSLQRDLARSPVQMVVTTDKGGSKLRDVNSILQDHSTVARHTQADLSLQRSYYEPYTQTFHEACTPLRNLPAKFHQEVQDWLDLVDPSGKLTDWVAAVPRLDRQLCAVYLDGPKGVGKTLLATSLARLWTTGGPTPLKNVLGDFTELLVKCPIMLADEALPQRPGITAEIRNLIGTTSRTLNRKFLPQTSLVGAVRLVIAGNNERLMVTGEELSANDLEAVAARIYYIKATKAPAEYLESIGGPPKVQQWISQDLVAEHCLYLRNTRQLPEGSRFLVEGDESAFHRQLALGAGAGATVSEWLVRYLADPNPQSGGLVQLGSGELWVNTEALARETSWTKYVQSRKVPTAAQVSLALRGISQEHVSVADATGKVVTFHVVDPELILAFVDRLQIGDMAAIRSRFAKPNPTISAFRAGPKGEL